MTMQSNNPNGIKIFFLCGCFCEGIIAGEACSEDSGRGVCATESVVSIKIGRSMTTSIRVLWRFFTCQDLKIQNLLLDKQSTYVLTYTYEENNTTSARNMGYCRYCLSFSSFLVRSRK